MDWIYEPWPWYVSGAAIALIMLLLLLVGKNFGMSSNLRTLCTICGADRKAEFFRFDWSAQKWNLIVVLGAIIGGFIASFLLTADPAVHINPNTVQGLQALGFESAGTAYLPSELYAMDVLTDPKSLLLLAIGGFLVGFGARYAGGCTSGHAISGLSNLQWPSLVAVIGFFAGGLFMIYVLFPLIFS
ncbi:YeeE/YedE thiosulfate transporter family protein [Robiginitalea sp. M366]|uniref:YeeE/YedE family protein n=1 Tax=Robiginitalea aestuariiviva TaxID=3036903 RepID=UPI00240D6D58|nr:YeeE/YedE thiosulfate transporter family protein [Robiginitalea aestuariiviva]MDG1571562.1 YeeE/YedE thiosulfate transporter family protein [Robiginitalea aestuariiviva]